MALWEILALIDWLYDIFSPCKIPNILRAVGLNFLVNDTNLIENLEGKKIEQLKHFTSRQLNEPISIFPFFLFVDGKFTHLCFYAVIFSFLFI